MYQHFQELVAKWQETIDLLASLVGIPTALIMRIDGDEIEVFVTSNSEGNPYAKGDCEHLPGSGLYCETVIRKRQRLLVPFAPEDPDWDSNPDIKLGMVSYLGYPLILPDGAVFGTICILDAKKNNYSETVDALLRQFKLLIESTFQIIDDRNRLNIAFSEIKQLRGLLPMCAYCRKIRDDDGFWQHVEQYITTHTGTKFSHGMCPACVQEHYPEMLEDHPDSA